MAEEIIDMHKDGGRGNGGLIATIIILAIVVLALGAYAIYPVIRPKKSASVATATATVVKTATAKTSATSTGVTAGLKTFSSSTYGFSFKYPSGLTVEDKGKEVYLYTSEDYATLKKMEAEQAPTEGPAPKFVVAYYANLAAADGNNPPKYNSLQEMLSDGAIYSGTIATTFAGLPAYQTVESGLWDIFEYVVQKDEAIYKVQFPGVKSKSDLTATDKQVLASFEFTK